MIDNGVKLLVIPPGGWRFEQTIENSSPFKIEGQTYPQLENKVFEFRISNIEIIPSGTATRESVRDDIRAFICSRYPSQCTEYKQETKPVPNAVVSYRPPISRLDDWFKKLSVSNIQWRDAATALQNAAICSACPQNINWRTGCAPCVESVQRRLARYKGDRSTTLDARLLSCRCFGHHNELSIWMTNTFSEAKEPAPEHCWNK